MSTPPHSPDPNSSLLTAKNVFVTVPKDNSLSPDDAATLEWILFYSASNAETLRVNLVSSDGGILTAPVEKNQTALVMVKLGFSAPPPLEGAKVSNNPLPPITWEEKTDGNFATAIADSHAEGKPQSLHFVVTPETVGSELRASIASTVQNIATQVGDDRKNFSVAFINRIGNSASGDSFNKALNQIEPDILTVPSFDQIRANYQGNEHGFKKLAHVCFKE